MRVFTVGSPWVPSGCCSPAVTHVLITKCHCCVFSFLNLNITHVVNWCGVSTGREAERPWRERARGAVPRGPPCTHTARKVFSLSGGTSCLTSACVYRGASVTPTLHTHSGVEERGPRATRCSGKITRHDAEFSGQKCAGCG